MKYKIILFFVLFSIKSYSQLDTNNQDYFQYEKETIIKDLGIFNIENFMNSEIIFSSNHKDITDKILYDNRNDELNFNGTYKMINQTNPNESYYFKYGWHQVKKTTRLKNVNWLKKVPSAKGLYRILAVNIPFVQYGHIEVCTIGDSQTWWSEAQNLRKLMNNLNQDFKFTGSNQDIFGYPHEGEGGNNSIQVLNRIHLIPKAQIYTILLGTNDYKNEVKEVANNLLTLCNEIMKKNKKAVIFYITPLPTINKERSKFNEELKLMF